RTSVQRTNVASITDIGPTVQCAIFDCASPREQADVAEILSKQQGASPILILAGPNVDRSALPVNAVWLDDFSAIFDAERSESTVVESFKHVASQAASASIIVAPWDLLFDGVLDFFGNATPGLRRFAQVLILDAHAFPALGLHRCFSLARQRVV